MSSKLFLKRFLVFLLVLTALSACNVRRETALFNAPSDIVTDTIKHVYIVNDQGANDYYRIKIDDRLIVRNLQQDESTYTGKISAADAVSAESTQSFQVDSAGYLTIPTVNEKIMVAGLTRRQVTNKLQEVFEKIIKVNNPIIEVTIANLKVTLLGEFARQGNYLLERDNVSLVEIIGQAGGITNQADPKTLKIIRGKRSDPEIIYVNLNDINSLASNKLILQNNDIVLLQPQKSFATTNKLQSINNYIQPVLVLLNLGLLILTITK